MENVIREVYGVLKSGGSILYPTDTIWGVGCDATNAEAIDKIYKIKERDVNKPMLVILDDDRKLMRYVKDVPEVAWDILDHNEDPLTIIYPQAMGLATNLPAANGSIGIRIVKHPFCQALIRKYNKPLVSTSANFSGEPSPKNYDEISEELKNQVDYIVPQEYTSGNQKASGIIKLGVGGQVQIIRK